MNKKVITEPNKVHVYPIDIYLCDLVICIGTSAETMNNVFEQGDGDFVRNCDGRTFLTTRKISDDVAKRCAVCWFRDSSCFTPETMAHEAFHAAFEILSNIGTSVNVETAEPTAYLLDYIVRFMSRHVKTTFVGDKS